MSFGERLSCGVRKRNELAETPFRLADGVFELGELYRTTDQVL
jgi:hypothetical protein